MPKLGIKEVDDGIWLVGFMHDDLGYFGLEQMTLQALDKPIGGQHSPVGPDEDARLVAYRLRRAAWSNEAEARHFNRPLVYPRIGVA